MLLEVKTLEARKSDWYDSGLCAISAAKCLDSNTVVQ
jgi:hypothetical protein